MKDKAESMEGLKRVNRFTGREKKRENLIFDNPNGTERLGIEQWSDCGLGEAPSEPF